MRRGAAVIVISAVVAGCQPKPGAPGTVIADGGGPAPPGQPFVPPAPGQAVDTITSETPQFGSSALFPPLAPGDSRLEALPQGPMEILDTPAWYKGSEVTLRFFPRPSVGTGRSLNRHADLFIFLNGADGSLIDQPFLLEAVPKGAAGPNVSIPDEVARAFSSRWEVHVLRMAAGYDPNDPAKVVDSTSKFLSPQILEDIQTNVYLNCPVLPPGATIPSDPSVIHSATWNGHPVRIATYEADDAPQAPVPLYVFRRPDGTFQGRPVVVRIPGQENYSSLWDVRAVEVPGFFEPNTLRSHQDIVASRLPVTSLGFEVNCPVVAITGIDGSKVPVTRRDATSLLVGPDGRFSDLLFPRDVRNVPFQTDRVVRLVSRGLSIDDPNHNFVITQVAGPRSLFATPTLPPIFRLDELIHDASGSLVHLAQTDLDRGVLTAPIDSNTRAFLPPDAPFVQKVALVGQAFFSHPFTKKEGSGPLLNRTSCAACHMLNQTGGGGPAMFTVQQDPAPNTFDVMPLVAEIARVQRIDPAAALARLGPTLQPTAPRILRRTPHVFASGLKDELARERGSTGSDAKPFLFKRKGTVPSLRAFTIGALEGELGIQAVEKVAADSGVTLEEAALMDPDGDGVRAELTVGDVTAMVAFEASLPPPTRLPPLGLARQGELLGPNLMLPGEVLFTTPISAGGLGCASCHIPFTPLRSGTLSISNPETPGTLELPLQADASPLDASVQGLHAYSDFQRHKMGNLITDGADQEGVAKDVFLTKELWGLGSSAPYLHDGSAGGDVAAAIRAHRGSLLQGAGVAVSANQQPLVAAVQSSSVLHVVLPAGVTQAGIAIRAGSLPVRFPIRVVVTAIAGGTVANADAGGKEAGAAFLLAGLDTAGSAVVTPSFVAPAGGAISFDVGVADDSGYSEALGAAEAWSRLAPRDQDAVVRFLRSLRLGDDLVDDRGFEVQNP